MFRKNYLAAAVIVMSSSLASNVSALDLDTLYVLGGMGSTKYSSDGDSTTGFSVGAGIKVSDELAVEGRYVGQGTEEASTSVNPTSTSTVTRKAEMGASGFQLMGVYSLPIGPGSAYALGGLYLWKQEITASQSCTDTSSWGICSSYSTGSTTTTGDGNDIMFGGGYDFPLNDNLKVYGEYVIVNTEGDGIKTMSAGIKYSM